MRRRIIGTLILLCGLAGILWPQEPDPEVATAWVEIAYLVIAIGLSYLAGELLDKDAVLSDDKPTTVATRGSFVPVIKGRHRLGPVFGWADNRTSHTRVIAGQKGGLLGDKAREKAYNEDGWHLLCIGPCRTLWEIDQNGVILFAGPINSTSHPSGSTISLGNLAGDFRIFWGEVEQPVNNYLGDADRVGVTSKWPGLCYIEWRGKSLGTQPVWGQMTYVIESFPEEVHLTETEGTSPPSKIPWGPEYAGRQPSSRFYDPEDFGTNFDIMSFVSGTAPNAYIEVPFLHAHVGTFPASQQNGITQIRLKDNTDFASNKTYDCDNVVLVDLGSPPIGHYLELRTRWFVAPGQTIPATITSLQEVKSFGEILVDFPHADNGTVQVLVDGFDGGWNGAHVIASLLFDVWPNGIAQDQTKWDMVSLEALGTLLEAEGLRCGAVARKGKSVRDVLGGLMQDLGVTISMNPRTALLEFVPWRLPIPPLANIPIEAMVRRPERRLILGPRRIDRLVFSFSDESHAFRDMTIHVDDDGQATRKEFYTQDVVPIMATTIYDTAALIAQRRSAEELTKANTFRIFANRAARALSPGEAIVVEGFDEVLRVTTVKTDPLSGEVELTLLNDFYGATLSDFVQNPGKISGTGPGAPTGVRFVLVEVPEALTGAGGPQAVMVLPLRLKSTVTSHSVFLSQDGSTYTGAGAEDAVITGGQLTDGLLAEGEWALDQGPEFEVTGEDIGDVLDLSADLPSWRNGRQMAVMVNLAGEQEIMFLQKVTFISGDTYRLDGLIRARFDTSPASFGPGTTVAIIQNDEGTLIEDVLLEPGIDIYAKAAPSNVQLSTVGPIKIALYGKGVRPLPVTNVRLDLGSDSAGTGTAGRTDFEYLVTGAAPADDLLLTWSYKTPQSTNTGAGEFAAGTIQLDPPPEGDFVVEILDSGDVVVRSTSTATNSFLYIRSDRIADFTSEPTLFKVRITQTRGGQLADAVTQTISKF